MIAIDGFLWLVSHSDWFSSVEEFFVMCELLKTESENEGSIAIHWSSSLALSVYKFTCLSSFYLSRVTHAAIHLPGTGRSRARARARSHARDAFEQGNPVPVPLHFRAKVVHRIFN